MTHVVTDNCRDCRFTDCVSVCPVDCFHADERMLYIDPLVCIDCGACVPECPVEAIYEEGDLPIDQLQWLEVNAERAANLSVISEQQEPLGTAEERAKAMGYRSR
jgi:ferredoxin